VERLGADPRQHGNPAPYALDDRLERVEALARREAEDLPRESEAQQALRTGLHGEARNGGLRREVEGAIFGERRRDAREYPLPRRRRTHGCTSARPATSPLRALIAEPAGEEKIVRRSLAFRRRGSSESS